MKNILYFILGLAYLPIIMVLAAVGYIKNLGENVVDNYKWQKRFNKLKKVES